MIEESKVAAVAQPSGWKLVPTTLNYSNAHSEMMGVLLQLENGKICIIDAYAAVIAAAPATPVAQPSAERTDGAPAEIWLQLHGDGGPDGEPVDYTDEVSWCWHQVHEHDVRYVLAPAGAGEPTEPSGSA